MGVATEHFEQVLRQTLTEDQLAARRRRAELSGPNVEITPERRVAVRDRPQQTPRILGEIATYTTD